MNNFLRILNSTQSLVGGKKISLFAANYTNESDWFIQFKRESDGEHVAIKAEKECKEDKIFILSIHIGMRRFDTSQEEVSRLINLFTMFALKQEN